MKHMCTHVTRPPLSAQYVSSRRPRHIQDVACMIYPDGLSHPADPLARSTIHTHCSGPTERR
eukprot:7389475-Prymnesium_polylepis.1